MPASDWREYANCVGTDIELFFPERPGPASKDARAICAACPVREDCLEDALAYDDYDDYGIWGGTTPGERRHIRHQRRRGVLAAPMFDPPARGHLTIAS
jgi:WhiB family redox-sensing transcriptional regulator